MKTADSIFDKASSRLMPGRAPVRVLPNWTRHRRSPLAMSRLLDSTGRTLLDSSGKIQLATPGHTTGCCGCTRCACNDGTSARNLSGWAVTTLGLTLCSGYTGKGWTNTNINWSGIIPASALSASCAVNYVVNLGAGSGSFAGANIGLQFAFNAGVNTGSSDVLSFVYYSTFAGTWVSAGVNAFYSASSFTVSCTGSVTVNNYFTSGQCGTNVLGATVEAYGGSITITPRS